MKRKGKEDGEEKVPRASFDYFFMSQEGEKAHKNPMIATVDETTEDKYALAVGQKVIGAGHEMEWLVTDMSDELKAWAHAGTTGGELIVKGGGESAIRAVRGALAKYHGGRMIPEGPPKGESHSNGAIEEAGKTIREFTRVYKDQVEEKAGIKLECDAAIALWMIRRAALACSQYLVGKGGQTANERRRGRPCTDKLVAIGENMWCRKARDTKDRANQFESEREQGILLGRARESNETFVGTSAGAMRAYAIKRRAQRREMGQRVDHGH